MNLTRLLARGAALAAGALALAAGPLMAGANTIHVPTDYPTIQQGVNAANPGDTVQVAAGTYIEQVVINTPITLAGAGQGSTIIQSP
ncbi:MAG TPA: hypothetical protein VKT32_15185, partial [Chthonomonadaceae bacterium]|nr:hypothetical protein [Chthonomonadaceae bacterium]